MASEEIPKITVRSVCGKVAIPDEPVNVMTVIGIATDAKIKQGDVGGYVVFSGVFHARSLNAEKKITFVSKRMVLPEIASRAVVAGLQKSKSGSVELAYLITVKKSRSMGGVDFDTLALAPVVDSNPIDYLVAEIESSDEYGELVEGKSVVKSAPVKQARKVLVKVSRKVSGENDGHKKGDGAGLDLSGSEAATANSV